MFNCNVYTVRQSVNIGQLRVTHNRRRNRTRERLAISGKVSSLREFGVLFRSYFFNRFRRHLSVGFVVILNTIRNLTETIYYVGSASTHPILFLFLMGNFKTIVVTQFFSKF